VVFNAAQEAQLELIRVTSANELSGDQVASDLRSHPELWKAAVIGPEDIGTTLVYLDLGTSAAASVYILASGRDDEALKSLAEGWNPSSVSWETGIVGPNTGRVLRVWWD